MTRIPRTQAAGAARLAAFFFAARTSLRDAKNRPLSLMNAAQRITSFTEPFVGPVVAAALLMIGREWTNGGTKPGGQLR